MFFQKIEPSNRFLFNIFISFLFLTLLFSSKLYAEENEMPSLPLTTSVYSFSDDGNTLNGGVAVPVWQDSTPSLLSYVPAKVSLDELDNVSSISTNGIMSVASANAIFTINFLTSGTDAVGQACGAFPANAKAVFTAAANIWGSVIQSSVPIIIDACWANMGTSSGLLGYAGSRIQQRDFANAPVASTWYPSALANSLAGSDLSPSLPDIFATFNSAFTWYYGTDGNTPNTKHDLLTVVLHEMGHGLGFAGSASYSTATNQGVWGLGTPKRQIIYDDFVKDNSGNKITSYSNPSVALGNFLKSNNVLFTGGNAVSANGGNNVKLYAPSTWQRGSSYSHLDYNTFNNTLNQLMVPSVSAGEAVHDPGVVTKGLFKDIGWQLSGGGTTPSKATLISPSGTVADTTPTYTWNAVSGSTWYYLYVSKGTSKKVGKWYAATSAGCGSGSGTCSATPATTLGGGSHTWWIRTNNSLGNGPWSSPKAFSVSTGGGTPGKATLISPSGTVADTTPTYTWNAVSGSTWYYLYVSKGTSKKVGKWYAATSAGCGSGSGTCSAAPAVTLGSGSHTWWIRTNNSSGNGPWSSPKAFSVSTGGGTPGKATLISPSGTVADTTPTYTWNAVNGSTWYRIWVKKGSSNKTVLWYSAASAGCGSGTGTCSVTPATTLSSGSHTWWIRTYNSSGNGPWSNGKIFSVVPSSAGFNSQFNGNAIGWHSVAGANWQVGSSSAAIYSAANKFTSIYYQPVQFSNFEYSARIWRGAGAEDGFANRLIVRGNPNSLDSLNSWNSYAFQVTRNGYYSIWKYENGSTPFLQDWTASTAINQGNAWNTLTVWASGNNLWFGINGTWVKNVTDSTFTAGKVGIGLYSESNTDRLWVDWAKLTPLGGASVVVNSTTGNRKVSDKQLQLNAIANQNPSGSIDGTGSN